ncbi:MAG: precorrin-8X methylmutase [Thermodesulfovibrionales bacterium]|nr:precorrin-8X methylmutase [Thermodesulfovibrionales bacterium]
MESIILIGHGSPKRDANNIETIGRLLHSMIHPDCSKECVMVAYLQFAKPELSDTIKESIRKGAKKIIIHPYFLISGMHVTKDIPEMIKEAEKLYPDVEFIYTEPLGIHEKLAQVIAERIKTAGALMPSEIEKKSFEIISDEIDLTDVPQEQVPIIKRVIHTTADFEFKKTLLFHPDAITAGINAIKSGKDILADVEMVKAGINKKLLKKWGGEVICRIQDAGCRMQEGTVPNFSPRRIRLSAERTQQSGVPALVIASGAKQSQQPFGAGSELGLSPATKAEMGIESALKENNNIGIIAIGNAPTALLKIIDLLNNPHYASRITHHGLLVIGVPVGFVKAFESKALLSAQKFPFITNLSRKGGSPVAAAIVNALLKMAEGGDI